MENIEKKIKEVEKKLNDHSMAFDLLSELKKSNKRFFVALMVTVSMWIATVFGFIWFLSQYNFETSYESSGFYSMIDSNGNIIAQDISDEQVQAFNQWWEVNNNGNGQGN